MAQMQPIGKTAKGRAPVNVDLTPMVDLAFLLICFFMLATVLSENKALDLSMPEKSDTPGELAGSRSLTLIATGGEVWYYQGEDPGQMQMTNYAASGIREVIYRAQKKSLAATGDSLMCLIKFHESAAYHAMVDLLDEMLITNTRYYAIQDMVESEKQVLNNKK